MAEYTITELSTLTGVNRRNIHFYIQQGLVPPADGAGLGARYTDEHLLRLRAIPVLRSRGLRLDAIREHLAGMDGGAVRALLAQPPADTSLPRPAPPAVPAETVTRYRLAPGVELLIGPEADPAWHRRAAELAAAIQQPAYPPTDFQHHGGES